MGDLGIHRMSSNPCIWDWGEKMIVMVRRDMTEADDTTPTTSKTTISEPPPSSVNDQYPRQEVSKGLELPEDYEARSLKEFKYDDLKKATKNFSPDLILGEGGFGKVHNQSHVLSKILIKKIPPELQCGFIAAVDEGSIKTMANRSMSAALQPTPGAILLGDSFNMRHPLTEGGMTVALSVVVIVHDLLKPLENINDSYALCNGIYKYKVFSASPDQARTELCQACFDYLSLGGMFSSGPIAFSQGSLANEALVVLPNWTVGMVGVPADTV
ncbi:squalene epoxidase, FAD/NAD(P)-binding domain protein [Artemisia annua]|uniref:Squalene monooxygenase n=1 Tax=Artemisia annua TaxID=35608 RepID=A0A2U1NPX2_ARTAN|nr:squalene epoxidase, FAD/NAD(P)-binding domain protein [Artemisia annua]